jgi:hypothetical protein
MRERKKALAVLGCLRGIRTAVIARCLRMSRKRRPQCALIGEDDKAER